MIALLVKYLIDEDTEHLIREGLWRRQPSIDIKVIGEQGVPTLSTKDADILDFLEVEGYVLVSSNRRTMPRHLKDHLNKGGTVPGIFLLRKGTSYRRILENLELVWYVGELDEYRDKITYIPL